MKIGTSILWEKNKRNALSLFAPMEEEVNKLKTAFADFSSPYI